MVGGSASQQDRSPGLRHMHVGGGGWRRRQQRLASAQKLAVAAAAAVCYNNGGSLPCRFTSRQSAALPVCTATPMSPPAAPPLQVPVPPQYKPQPLYDFRHFPSETRGYKVGAGRCLGCAL